MANTSLDSSFLLSPLGIVLSILLLIVVLFILYIIIKKISYARKLNKERRSIRDDLMIWSSLQRLVSGGKKTKQGKKDLSPNILIIKDIFIHARPLLRAILVLAKDLLGMCL